MRNLLIRNVPRQLHKQLKQQAKKDAVSINGEVLLLLQKGLLFSNKKMIHPIKLTKPVSLEFLEKAINEGHE